ncbi:uncharacterized protein LOC111704331 [Eurytemora carolleeae]|uniref:uncharacterized protein LOC111704331 n=1 Tax=Eurytemora carolleeae TaxID=1294199 RepID=UPI000C7722FA|nr:uncharacterized protein LOC111704331 [Eurytemora carolleeae]|eukprot:XP_023332324.1 uncharacterized protein LOC111704331 [Eurytemora affinis]
MQVGSKHVNKHSTDSRQLFTPKKENQVVWSSLSSEEDDLPGNPDFEREIQILFRNIRRQSKRMQRVKKPMSLSKEGEGGYSFENIYDRALLPLNSPPCHPFKYDPFDKNRERKHEKTENQNRASEKRDERKRQVSQSIIISGESGSGKSVLAHSILNELFRLLKNF